MPLGTTLPYGIRDIKITPFTTAAATAYGAAVIDLPNAQTLTWTESEDYEELRGDDVLVASHGQGPGIEWDIESGGISFEAFAAMNGGTVTSSGTTPNQIKTYSKLATDVRPYFYLEGQSISDSGGDFHTVLYKCKATKDIKGEQKDGSFLVPAISGQCFGSTVSSKLGALYAFVQNETAVANALPT